MSNKGKAPKGPSAVPGESVQAGSSSVPADKASKASNAAGKASPVAPGDGPAAPGDTQSAQSDARKRAQGVVQHARKDAVTVERGLVALALCSGSSRRAARLLAEQGLSLGESTLRNWRDNLYPERYWELQRDVLPKLRARAAEQHSELAELEGEAGRKLLERLTAEYGAIPARDLPGAIRNLDVGAAVNRDKAAMLRGENPETTMPTRSMSEIVSALKAKGVVDLSKLRFTQTLEVEKPTDAAPEAIEGTATEQD